MLSRLFPMLLLSAGLGLAQDFPYLEVVDLKLGRGDAPDMLLVELGRIRTGVVFQRLPHPTICPVTRGAEFALEKVNPNPRRFAVTEHISNICTLIDTVTLDTTAVYKVHTPTGELYFLQLVERVGEKARVRISKEPPSAVKARPAAKPSAFREDPAYRLDGRALPALPSSDFIGR